jgi:hypothetical protein
MAHSLAPFGKMNLIGKWLAATEMTPYCGYSRTIDVRRNVRMLSLGGVDPRHTVVFTGAGISGAGPAKLPAGFALRDEILNLVNLAGTKVPEVGGLITAIQLSDLIHSSTKLEVVLGRLCSTLDADTISVLQTLKLTIPNEAHLLSAIHLARGGTHLTLNFDIGIERAFELLTCRTELPPNAPKEYSERLRDWRRLVPSETPALRVVASHGDFRDWNTDGRPAALLKLHGSLTADQLALTDVVVVDTEELAQLAPDRRAALDRVAEARLLLITGYCGVDPDVYRPLIEAAPRGRGGATSWRCYSLPNDSPVPADLHPDIELVRGSPQGLASTALRELLDLAGAPAWPETLSPGPTFKDRFDAWSTQFTATHPGHLFAEAWAWLLADLGDLDGAEAIIAAVATHYPSARLRHAETLYTRARGNDRERAAALFREFGSGRRGDARARTHALLRAGDIARGRAVLGPRAAITNLPTALTAPLRVLILTRHGQLDPEAAADAYRALQQTGLRVTERVAATGTIAWPLLAAGAHVFIAAGRRADQLSSNGNRRALVQQQRLLLEALSALFLRRPPRQDLDVQLRNLHDAYHSANDLPGAGNCTAARAIVATARGDQSDTVMAMLDKAKYEFAWERHDRDPIVAGAALVAVLARVIDRAELGGKRTAHPRRQR